MRSTRHKTTDLIAAIASICPFLMVSTVEAQISKTNSSIQPVVMETNIVDLAMPLIRQHKFAEAKEILLSAADKGQPEPQALLGQMGQEITRVQSRMPYAIRIKVQKKNTITKVASALVLVGCFELFMYLYDLN